MPVVGPGETPRASTTVRPRPPAKGKPSSRPARVMIAAGAVAALTVIGAGLVRFPVAADDPVAATPETADTATTAQAATSARVKATRPVKYVRLKPGQKAPKGAKVIREAAPTPRVVIRRVTPTVRQAPQPAPRRVVTRTRQSG